MWDRRAEMFVAMLQYQGSGMVEGDIEAATAQEWAVRDELTAKAAAFASDEVRDLWQESAWANRGLQQYVSRSVAAADRWRRVDRNRGRGGKRPGTAEAPPSQRTRRRAANRADQDRTGRPPPQAPAPTREAKSRPPAVEGLKASGLHSRRATKFRAAQRPS